MKRLICLTLIIEVLFFAVPYSSIAKNNHIESADSSLLIIPSIYNPTIGPPKAPIHIPISASYHRTTKSIQLSFLYNIGAIEVEILNTSTGHIETGSISSAYLSAIIPLSGGPGHYIIYFYLPSNKKYFCELEV